MNDQISDFLTNLITQLPAILTAIGGILVILRGQQKMAETAKETAEETKTIVLETAKVAKDVASAKDSVASEKLDTIHELVNSNLTAAKEGRAIAEAKVEELELKLGITKKGVNDGNKGRSSK